MSRTVWITGAGTGIGKALALSYAADGYRVFVTGRNRDALHAVVADAALLAGEVVAYPGDVTDAAGMAAIVEMLYARSELPDLAVLNAGNHIPTWAKDFEAAPYRSLMETNYMGVVHCLEALVPKMRARGAGQIAVVASLAGYRGLPGAAAYGASKAALINMAEALKPDLARYGVDLRLVNPGFVATPLTDRNDFDMPFLIEAAVAAKAIRRGLGGTAFEIVMPRRFAFMMKILRMLPDRLFCALTRRLVR